MDGWILAGWHWGSAPSRFERKRRNVGWCCRCTISKLMDPLGHASPTTAMCYRHATVERDRMLSDRLGALMMPSEESPLGRFGVLNPAWLDLAIARWLYAAEVLHITRSNRVSEDRRRHSPTGVSNRDLAQQRTSQGRSKATHRHVRAIGAPPALTLSEQAISEEGLPGFSPKFDGEGETSTVDVEELHTRSTYVREETQRNNRE